MLTDYTAVRYHSDYSLLQLDASFHFKGLSYVPRQSLWHLCWETWHLWSSFYLYLGYSLSLITIFSVTYNNILCHLQQYSLSLTTIFSVTYHNILCHLPQYSLSLTTIFSVTSHFYIHSPVMDARVSKTALICDSQCGFNLRQDTKAVYPSVLKSIKDSWFLATKSWHVFSHIQRIFVDRVSAASLEQTRHTCL
jgi:hypothetical protein